MVRNIVCFGDSNTYGYCGDPKILIIAPPHISKDRDAVMHE